MIPTSEQLKRNPVMLADIFRPIAYDLDGYADATVSKIERNPAGAIVAVTMARPYIHTADTEYSSSPQDNANKASAAIVYTGLETWRVELSSLTDGPRRYYRLVSRRFAPLK